MYLLNNKRYDLEECLSLKSIVVKYEKDVTDDLVKVFENYIILNKKKINRNEMSDIIIKDGDEIIIMPVMGAG